MPVCLYMDESVHGAIVEQLRRRNIDVLTVVEDGLRSTADDEVLKRAHDLGRVVFTQDIRFKRLAESWTASAIPHSGLVFGHPMHASIGVFVENLELIAKASEKSEWLNRTDWLPYRSRSGQ